MFFLLHFLELLFGAVLASVFFSNFVLVGILSFF